MIIKYRYPDGSDGKKLTYQETFDKMKEEGVLPSTWEAPMSIAKFIERVSKRNTEVDETNIFALLKPIIYKIPIKEETRFFLYWSGLTEDGKHELMNWLGQTILVQGISVTEVANVLANKLSERGYLAKETVRKYIKKEFKDFEMRDRKLGKTFSKNYRGGIGMKVRSAI